MVREGVMPGGVFDNGGGDTALNAAGRRGRSNVIDILVDAGIPVDVRGAAELTPLMTAVSSGVDSGPKESVRTVRRLLERGADPNADANGIALLAFVGSMHDKGDAMEIYQALVDAGARLEGTEVLHHACMSGRLPVAMIAAMLDAGTAVDARDRYGASPLWYAARSNKLDYVKLLLARGADPKVRLGRDGASVYEAARPNADLPLLALLRDAGAVDEPRGSGAPKQPDDAFRVGATVTHKKFGLGEVTATEGAGEDRKLTVKFADASRTLLAKFVSAGAPSPNA